MRAARTEQLVHWGILSVLLLNALWIFTLPSFPTLDGWTHLHTARMLFDGLPEGVYCANPSMVPNRFGHLLLGVLQSVLPAMVAERVLLALILLGLGVGAYALARSFGGRSPLILLVLPFTVNFLLVLGFHNFLLGMALALLLVAWWVRRKGSNWMGFVLFAAATFLLFYTHTTALVLFLLLTGSHEFVGLLGLHPGNTSPTTSTRWRRFLSFALASLPAGLFFLWFNAGQATAWGEVDHANNLRELFDLRSILLFHYDAEAKFNYAVKLLLVGTMLLAVDTRFRKKTTLRLQHSDVPLLVGVLLLALYFILPDSSGYASYITVRLQLMALFLLIIWMATQPIALPSAAIPVIMILFVQNARNNHIESAQAPIAERRDQLLVAAEHLPAGSIVLPISTEDNWLLGHASSLLAVEREVVLLDNYECNTGYFPLIWCPGLPEELHAHIGGGDRCLGWLPQHIQENAAPRIDRIVLFGYAEDTLSCGAKNLREVLNTRFKPGYANAYARIYERR